MHNDERTRPPGGRIFRLGSGPQRVERDVDTELAFHLDMRIRKLVERGMDPVTARAQALRQFGDWDMVRSQMLDIDYQQEKAVTRANYFAELRQDALYGLRSLSHNVGFALVIVLSLAIAIGANTAIFTLINALILRPLPVPNAEQLVVIGDGRRVNSASNGSLRTDLFSYRAYVDLRKNLPLLSGLAATGRTGRLEVVIDDARSRSAGTNAGPEVVRGRLVSGNYFSVLRLAPAAGRFVTPDDDRLANGAPVVVLSHDYWMRRFAGDRGVIGRSITINRTPFTIIGVGPAGFHGEIVGRMMDVWMPLTMQPAVMHGRDWLNDASTSWLQFIGRRAPGVSLEQVAAAYPTLVRQTVAGTAPPGQERPQLEREEVLVSSAERGLSSLRSTFAEPLVTLMVAVGLVLLVVCANVANLLLARGAARARELGVRMALGAGRTRLIRQLLTESLIIGTLGGLVGLLFAYWGGKGLLSMASGGASGTLDTRLDWRVLLFTLVVTGITAVLFGVIPAFRATRVELAATLRSNSRGLTGGLLGAPGRMGAGKLLVMVQVALSLTLLIGTSMLVRSTRALSSIDVGLARDRLLIVTIDVAPTGQEGERLSSLARTLVERVRRVPGVVGASFSENGIFSGTESMTSVQIPGFVARTARDSSIKYDRVGPGYFDAIGARLISGRDILPTDDEQAARVAVVNATMASFYFPNGSALGKHVTIDSATYEIVGVIGDTRDHELRGQADRRLYLPIFQSGPLPSEFTFELRSAGDPAQLASGARRELLGADPSLLILSSDPLKSLMRSSISQDLLVATVASFFGTLALALAALGLYGVMTYATLRRTSEFGLRMALGAEPRTVGGMVLREAMILVVGGTVIGIPLALAVTRFLRNQLYGVQLVDVPSILVALGVLSASAAIAGLLPAARAARVGPLEALRTE